MKLKEILKNAEDRTNQLREMYGDDYQLAAKPLQEVESEILQSYISKEEVGKIIEELRQPFTVSENMELRDAYNQALDNVKSKLTGDKHLEKGRE